MRRQRQLPIRIATGLAVRRVSSSAFSLELFGLAFRLPSIMARTGEQYRSAIEFLYELRWFGTKLGLENVRDLANRTGNPERRLRFIHVAGTNGKGSTCAMLESIYRAAGLRVGLFTSPHLMSFRERIQVNRRWISEADVVRIVDWLRGFVEVPGAAGHPTFFEVVTVMALRYFEEQQCELVVWETGLGGRLDATNIVNPLASVITNIQFDHEKWLGNSLAQIAGEKAGIIKPHTPVVTGVENAEALGVIEAVAAARHAPLIRADKESAARQTRGVHMPLAGNHQVHNAAVAVTTVNALQSIIPVPTEAVQSGLATVDWPGRLQVLTRSDGRKIVLDGAHNVAGAEALAVSVKGLFAGDPITLVLGVLGDKDHASICRILAPLARRILVVPVQSERSAEPKVLAEECQIAHPEASITCCASLRQALDSASGSATTLITGSLYLVGEALELLTPSEGRDERALNEWGGTQHTR